ncbi:hypothetical protein BC629DRAFT_1599585 [Irpex lacteus]|nr:hypothetical protein BC629DRAFT_1599585 [Irpex lacteus]
MNQAPRAAVSPSAILSSANQSTISSNSQREPSANLPGSFAEDSFVAESNQRHLSTIPEENLSLSNDDRDPSEDREEVARMLGLDSLGDEDDAATPRTTAEKLYERYTRDSATTLQTVERIFRLLQVLLATLAFEVPQRKAVDNYHYLLDPMGDLFPTLRGASSLEELFGAWDILRERLAKGDRFVSKYLEESQGAANVTSPASTTSDVYKPFEPAVSTAYRIREYCAKVPSHMTETDPSILDHLLDPNFALDELVDVPLQIKSVFPPRQPEENPLVFSYNEKGAKDTRPCTILLQKPSSLVNLYSTTALHEAPY